MAAEGGNAVDAALAAMLVTCVNEPGMVSLGGGAFVTVATPGHDPVVVDGYVEMPGRGLPAEAFGRGVWELDTAYGGGTTMSTGPGTVATPGLLPAIEETHRRFGVLPWTAIVEPAAEVARAGFPLGMACDYFLGHVREDLYGHDPAVRAALHHADGTPVRLGEQLVIPHLADFLDLVRRNGSASLMTGDAADALVGLMRAGGGLITHADLAEYAPVIRTATRADVRSFTFLTNPPPAIGGPVLAAMLLLLAATAPDGDEGGPGVSVAALVRVLRAVLRVRFSDLDTSDDLERSGRELLDAVRSAGPGWTGAGWIGSPSTAHVSAVDDDGAACSITASFGYGSGIEVPGTGVWLNNCLGEHELNVTGLHALPPGRRLASNMAPTIGRHADGTVLAVGSPGADRITTALAQVIVRLCGHPGQVDAEALEAAIGAPRLHIARGAAGGEELHVEADVELGELDAALGSDPGSDPESETAGEFADLVRREHHARSMYFGGVAAALRTADGELVAAADPRRDGAAAVSPPRG